MQSLKCYYSQLGMTDSKLKEKSNLAHTDVKPTEAS